MRQTENNRFAHISNQNIRIKDVEIYVWGGSQTYSYNIPQTSTTYGRLNSFNGFMPIRLPFQKSRYI